MKLFRKLRKPWERKVLERNLSALEGFLYQAESMDGISPEESWKIISRGLVEITYNNREHAANGILITENGYFLTSRHCVETPDNMKISHGGRRYRIKKICAYSPGGDIALAKIDLDGDFRPLGYMTATETNPKLPAVMVVMRKGKPVEKYGWIANNGGMICEGSENYISLNLNSRPGDSGSPLLDTERRLIGIHSGSDIRLLTSENAYVRTGVSYATRIEKGLGLIRFYAGRLKDRLGRL